MEATVTVEDLKEQVVDLQACLLEAGDDRDAAEARVEREFAEKEAYKFFTLQDGTKVPMLDMVGRIGYWRDQVDLLHDALDGSASNLLGWPAIQANDPDVDGEALDTLKLTQIGDLMLEPDEDVPWLVEERIAKSTVCAIAGPPKSGKSSLLRQMALAVAGGTEWLGNECNKHPVVFLSVEDNRRQAKAHFRAMGADMAAEVHIHCGPPPSEELIKTDEWVMRLIARHKAKLLVVENFAKLVSVEDWNDYATVTEALRPFDKIASTTGCAIIIGLHVRKSGGEDGTQVMGSTQWVGGPSTIFALERDGTYRTLSSMQREGDQMEKTLLSWDADTKTYSLGRTKREAQAEFVKEAVLGFLAGGEQADAGKIAEGIGRKRQSVTRTLNKMVDAGWLEVVGRGRSGDPFRYSLA